MVVAVETPAIEIDRMTVWRHRAVAVDRISLKADRAKWFGLIGANGSGKTSLLRAIAGRLPCEASACRIDGTDLRDSPRERAELVGFMPPAEYLPKALTCRELFRLIQPDEGLWRTGISGICEALAIERLLEKPVGDCSAGMKQRIAIGCAFANGNDIVLLDEPFNWLDPVAAYDLRRALRARVDNGLTLVTAFHDIVTMTSCDEGALLGRGKVVSLINGNDLRLDNEYNSGFEVKIIEILRKNSSIF